MRRTRSSIAFLVISTTTWLSAGLALAMPGEIDPTFGVDGWAFFGEDGVLAYRVNAMTIRPDDRIVVAGSLDDRFAIWQFLPDGGIDTAFGTDGVTIVPFASRVSEAHDVALLSDGRVVATGSVGRRIAAVRLLPEGEPDPTFGQGDGVVSARPAEHAESVAAEVVALPDGGLLLAGPILELRSFRDDSFLLRLDPDGGLEETFGSGGMIRDRRRFGAVVVDERGIVAALRSSGGRFAVARFDMTGSPDTTFGGDGIRSYCLFVRCEGYDMGSPTDVVVDPDGNLVLVFGGYFPYRHRVDSFAVLRLTADGERDASFAGDGLRTFRGSSFGSSASALAIQEDGRILMSGYILAGAGSGENWPVVARLLPQGRLDTSFGDDGMVFATRDDVFWSNADDMGLQLDGRIVLLIGVVYEPGFGLARLLSA